MLYASIATVLRLKFDLTQVSQTLADRGQADLSVWGDSTILAATCYGQNEDMTEEWFNSLLSKSVHDSDTWNNAMCTGEKKKLNADPFHFVIPQPNCTGSLSKSQFAGFSVYHEQMVFWGTEKPVK